MSEKSLLFSHAIRTARENRGLTQIELAAQLEVSQTTISFWESGIKAPSLENQVKLVNLIPEIIDLLAEHEANLLSRLYQLEQAIYGNKCSCERRGISAEP
jgi:transcriptional regulator with XRE-family HTH domain